MNFYLYETFINNFTDCQFCDDYLYRTQKAQTLYKRKNQ